MKCIAGIISGESERAYVSAHDTQALTNQRSKAYEFASIEAAAMALAMSRIGNDAEFFIVPFGYAETVRFTCCFCPNEAAHRAHRMHETLVCATCASDLKLKHLEPIK